MTVSSLGSIGAFGPAGRLGQVVGRQAVGESGEGGKIVALRIRSLQPLPAAEAGAAGRPSGPGPVRPLERSDLSVAPRIEAGPGAGVRPAARTPDRLSPEEKAVVDRLSQRDGQVRQEEQAHAAAAGDLAGPIDYIYQTGPDGRRYAVGGSVPLRARSFSGDPAELARLGARIAAAAQAATNPSGADLAAARKGYELAAQSAEPSDPKTRPGSALSIEA